MLISQALDTVRIKMGKCTAANKLHLAKDFTPTHSHCSYIGIVVFAALIVTWFKMILCNSHLVAVTITFFNSALTVSSLSVNEDRNMASGREAMSYKSGEVCSEGSVIQTGRKNCSIKVTWDFEQSSLSKNF